MAPSLALSKSEVLARNLATSLSYPELPRLSGALEGNLDLPDQSQALDAAVVLHVYHLLITAYHGGRRFLPQLNEHALHAAWSHLCSKLASLSPAPGDNLQVRSALLPGEAADRQAAQRGREQAARVALAAGWALRVLRTPLPVQLAQALRPLQLLPLQL